MVSTLPTSENGFINYNGGNITQYKALYSENLGVLNQNINEALESFRSNFIQITMASQTQLTPIINELDEKMDKGLSKAIKEHKSASTFLLDGQKNNPQTTTTTIKQTIRAKNDKAAGKGDNNKFTAWGNPEILSKSMDQDNFI